MSTDEFKLDVSDDTVMSLLRGGFVLPHDPGCGLVILLRGKSGTGKSTLALQILDMLVAKGERHYCTLEQTTDDLKFKLASMLVGQAIAKAREPDHEQGKILCNVDRFLHHLRNRLQTFDENFQEKLRTQLVSVSLPLYDEPSSEQREMCASAEYTLSNLIRKRIKDEWIQIHDTQGQNGGAIHEGPIGTFRSRVVLASRMINNVLQKSPRVQRNDAPKRARSPIIVVDGLSLLSASERETFELQKMAEYLQRFSQMAILVYEPNEDESTSLDHHADMVIELTRRSIKTPVSYLIHEICIRKARYQEAALGQHQFKIRNSGLVFFPSLHFQIHHYNYMELEQIRSKSEANRKPEPSSSADKPNSNTNPPKENVEKNVDREGSLIDLIFRPQKGESVVLLGSRNSFKTQLCLDYLARGGWGCWKNFGKSQKKEIEKGLLVSLIDNAPDIRRGLYCPWKKSQYPDCSYAKCKSEEKALIPHVHTFCQRPGCVTPAELFHYVKECIEPSAPERKSSDRFAERVVFWDLTQIDYRFPLLREDHMFVPALMDMFKTNKLKSLFMGAGNAENTKAASAMADYVLFCWRSHLPRSILAGITKPRKLTMEEPVQSLVLYVDRTPPTSSLHERKSLYYIPIYKGDKLMVPRFKSELEEKYKTELPTRKMDRYSYDMINRITEMQGVA